MVFKTKWGKWTIGLLLTAVFAGVAYNLINFIIKAITGGSGVFANALTFIALAGLLVAFLAFRPGKEDAIEVLITTLFVWGIFGLANGLGFVLLSFSPAQDPLGFLFGIASVVFGEGLSIRLLKAVKFR